MITIGTTFDISCLFHGYQIFFFTGTSSASSYPYQLKRTHGILNIFGWGVLLPIGAIVARYFKRSDPLWYYIHAVVQLIGFLIGLAGVVAGVALYDKLHADVSAHRGLGIFILVLGILQVLELLYSLFEKFVSVSSHCWSHFKLSYFCLLWFIHLFRILNDTRVDTGLLGSVVL